MERDTESFKLSSDAQCYAYVSMKHMQTYMYAHTYIQGCIDQEEMSEMETGKDGR